MNAVAGRLGALGLAAAIAALAQLWPTHMRSIVLWEQTLPQLAAAALLVALAPERHARLAQDAALLGLYVVQRLTALELGAAWGSWWDLPVGIAIGVVPWAKRRAQAIRLSALGLALGPLLPLPYGELTEHLFIQLLFVAAMTDGLGARDAARYTLSTLIAPRMSAPPPDILRVDRQAGSLALGAGWLALGLALARLPLARRLAERDPWGLLLDGDVTGGLVDAVRMCALSFLPVAARLLVLAATLRLIGIPIRAPVDAPWRATDLLDWWRRTHSWRSVVFRTAFLQHLGWAGPAATFGVFLLSGLQHAGAEADPWPHVAVWATLGVLAAINVAWIRVLSKRRVARWMATGVRPEPGRLARLVSLLAVMLVQGLALGLMPALDRGAPAEGAGEP